MKWISIAWRKQDDWIDFYQTPTWCIDKLLEKESFYWFILEPCSWAGAISKVLEKKFYTVLSQDIRTDDWVYWIKWVDFLWDYNYWIANIVTTPPL